MARPLRIEYPGAIYHVMSRGNGRQLLFHGPDDYQRMLDGLEKTVWRTGWEVFAFAWSGVREGDIESRGARLAACVTVAVADSTWWLV